MPESLKIQDEIESITSFLCNKYASVFRRGLEEDTIEITDPMEAIILASSTADSITPSFFLKRGDDGRLAEYHVDLSRDFTRLWASDHQKEYPQIFEGIKTVKFFRHWIPMVGYSGKNALRYEAKRRDDMLNHLYEEVRKSKKELSDVLFVPFSQYGGNNPSEQFSEAIYHYLVGLVFRESGYLVFDEYAPFLMTGSAITPDLSAFKTPRIEEILSVLRAKGVISNGAFEQELQLYGIFGRKSSIPLASCNSLTDADTIAIEVKRSERAYLVRNGAMQLSSYLGEAYGFYDEGYLMAPLFKADGSGFLSLETNGNLVFSKSKPGYTGPLDNSQLHKRNDQLKDVRRNMIFQLFKNMRFSKIISFCSKYAEIHSFSDLWYATDLIDIDSLIDELISDTS